MKLSIRQRCIILKVASSQRGDLLTMELWDDIKNKLMITEDESSTVFKAIPNTDQVIVDLTLYDKDSEQDIQLEKQERRVIKDALPQYKLFEPGEPVHVRELIKVLDASLTGA